MKLPYHRLPLSTPMDVRLSFVTCRFPMPGPIPGEVMR
jgi:hypothetical protein